MYDVTDKLYVEEETRLKAVGDIWKEKSWKILEKCLLTEK